MTHDIADKKDIEKLVNKFYERVQTDVLLGPIFSHLDWTKHLPVMYNFWSSIMFGDQSYRGNPFEKHISLPIGTEHFSKWIKIFTQTVDENFCGSKAEEIKERARSISGIFQHKLGLT